MDKANSYKNQPWTGLEKGSYSITKDDFVSQNLFTFKINKKSATSGLAYKQTLSQKEGKITATDQLKFWFPFQTTRSLYGVLKQQGFKIHLDAGSYQGNGFLYNVYASLQGTRTIGQRRVVKAGVQATRDNLSFNWRVRYSQNQNNITLYNKTSYANGGWRFGIVNALNVIQKSWNFSALQVGYKHSNGDDFYLRANAGKQKEFAPVDVQSYFQNLTFNYIHNFNLNTRFGLQVAGDLSHQKIKNASLTWEHKCSTAENTAIKIQGDLKRKLNISVKNNLPNYGSYIFGVGVKDFGNSNQLSYGIQLDLNL